MATARLALALSVSLAAAGSLAAHALAFLLAEPHAGQRAELLAETGHGHVDQLALAAGLLALLVVGLATLVLAGRRGERVPALPLRLFALGPPLAFTLQEALERLLGGHGLDAGLLSEPAFLLGLALQLPLGLAALLGAHLLARAALAAGAALRSEPALPPRRRPGTQPLLRADWPRSPALAGGHRGRAPPPGG